MIGDADHTRAALRGRLLKISHDAQRLVDVLDHPREPLPDDEHTAWAAGIAREAILALRTAERLSALVYGRSDLAEVRQNITVTASNSKG